jgi:hypothetical protein
MRSNKEDEGIGTSVTRAVYNRSSRRGFLARASAVLVGVGAMGVVEASTAAADAPACCTGHNCKAAGGSCPGVGMCPTGWTYTGYTWTCCAGNHLVYCSDCRSASTGQVCACSYRSRNSCTAGQTATEVSALAARRTR